MPHVGFRCPDRRFSPEGVAPVAQCLEHARTDLWRGCHWPAVLLQQMVEVPDERISPTRLSLCPRQVALKRRYPYVLDPAVEWLKVRGTLFHAGLAHTAGDGSELELVREFEGVQVEGRLDYCPEGLSWVIDWKTKAYLPADFMPPEAHQAQLSVYGWLLEGKGVTCEYGELVYFDMRKVRRFVVPLWSSAEVEAWLRARIPALKQAYDATAPLALPYGPDDPQAYQCRLCPVQHLCTTLAEQGE